MQTAQPLATDALRVEPLDSALGAEISGIDLSKSLDAVTIAALQDAYRTYRLLLIRDPNVTPESQAAFARVFGDIQIRQDYDVGLSKDVDTQYVSNERDDGILGLGELEFHCDQLFQDDPLKALILYAIEIPESGSVTSFCDTVKVYNSLPDDLKRRLADKSCMHLYDFKGAYADFQDPETATPGSPRANHPMIYTDPETGDRAIWVNRLTTIRVNELPPAESKSLIAEVRGYLNNDACIYRHHWQAGDLLIWNNRLLQHAREPFDEAAPRTLRRTPIITANG
ncbi:MAG: TauD/TfdA family dioxygenase [Rhodospirillaceae bacterium]|nr:TauD/TfdA family dioxygenase [Rhodospirillaceae bacterium]